MESQLAKEYGRAVGVGYGNDMIHAAISGQLMGQFRQFSKQSMAPVIGVDGGIDGQGASLGFAVKLKLKRGDSIMSDYIVAEKCIIADRPPMGIVAIKPLQVRDAEAGVFWPNPAQ